MENKTCNDSYFLLVFLQTCFCILFVLLFFFSTFSSCINLLQTSFKFVYLIVIGLTVLGQVSRLSCGLGFAL